MWECPDLFELRIEGTKEKRWVLVVNIGSGSVAGGSGGQYFVGQFDGNRFAADPTVSMPAWFDYGKDYYAAVSWSDVPKSDGRRLWLGWLSNWQYAQDVPTSPWRSAMSIPREVGLRRTAEGILLVQKPVREMTKLRRQHFSFKKKDVSTANRWLNQKAIHGNQCELKVEFDSAAHGVQGIKVLQGSGELTIIGVDRERGLVFVDRTHSGQVHFNPEFSGVHGAPLSVPGGKISLHVFVDASSVEVFVNDGERVITDSVFPSAGSQKLEFFGPEGNQNIHSFDLWNLKSVWP